MCTQTVLTNMDNPMNSPSRTFGFHYIPDDQHYRQVDLETWLPRLRQLGAGWLVLKAPPTRALPEAFLRGLLEAAVQPVVHFDWAAARTPALADVQLLCRTYARWGVRYVAFFNQPNRRAFWRGAQWAQQDLVERFLDLFLPLAVEALRVGLTPIFPPLQTGGDYWDTAFLRAALEGLQRRGSEGLLSELVIGAQAWAGDRPLDWGVGGPERWPGARPYCTPADEQDQCGFRVADWYDAIIRSVLNAPRPLFLFEMGCPPGEEHAARNLTMARLLKGETVDGHPPLPSAVIGGAFWLLSASPDDPTSSQAWYPPQGEPLPVVQTFAQWQNNTPKSGAPPARESRPISHYLLLPSYEWGIAEAHLEMIRPLIKRHKPTIGFSLEEAAQARRVTVIGSEEDFPEAALRQLRAGGCIVERLPADGTTLASHLCNGTAQD